MQEKLKEIEERYKELEDQMADPEIAADYSRVQALAKEHASLRNLAVLTTRARQVAADIADTRAISHDETDRGMASLAREELAELEEEKIRIEEELKAELVEKDPLDDKNIVMEIRAGTGGEEAGLFAGDLYRMYMKYSQQKNWGLEIVHSNETGVGSIKEIVFQIKGEGAYSRLKHESGVHRVQRIPTTESSGRIHTSAATVAVLPEAEEVDVQIDAEDVQIDVFHAGGHGGQNVQKVRRPADVHVHIMLDLILGLSDPHGGRLMKDRLDPLEDLRQGVPVADVAADELRLGVQVIGRPPGRVDLFGQVVENPDLVTAANQLIDDE